MLFDYLPPLKIQFHLFIFLLICNYRWHHLNQLHISILYLFHILFSTLHVKARERERYVMMHWCLSIYKFLTNCLLAQFFHHLLLKNYSKKINKFHNMTTKNEDAECKHSNCLPNYTHMTVIVCVKFLNFDSFFLVN